MTATSSSTWSALFEERTGLSFVAAILSGMSHAFSQIRQLSTCI
jgi:hypothetical protein